MATPKGTRAQRFPVCERMSLPGDCPSGAVSGTWPSTALTEPHRPVVGLERPAWTTPKPTGNARPDHLIGAAWSIAVQSGLPSPTKNQWHSVTDLAIWMRSEEHT